jgi:hypothetical protein
MNKVMQLNKIYYAKAKQELRISTLWVWVYGTVIPIQGSCDSL